MSDADSAVPAGHAPPETFCSYFVKHLIAKKGYVPGTFPEAAELAEHCDIVLTRHDGYSVTVACLVDREAHPGKTFTMSSLGVDAIGDALLVHSGRISGNKMPVTIEIFEIGPAEPGDSQRRRLAPYIRQSWRTKVLPYAWILDTASGEAWSSSRTARLFRAGGFRKLLTEPRLPESELQPPVIAAVTRPAFPVLSCLIAAALVAIFAAEVVFGVGGQNIDPSVPTLVAMGGLVRSYVLQQGEWYRLFSAPLLHSGVVHLALNSVALLLAGRALEGLLGRAWFGAIFVTGALSGAAFSLMLLPDTTVSVGASGAVTALFAAMLVVAFHFPPGAGRTPLLMDAIYVLIPSLLPLMPALQGQKVDYAAHFGGALGGLAVGALILALWPRDAARPRLQPLAAAVALTGLIAFAYPALPLSRSYAGNAFTANIIPQAQLPQTDPDAKARSADLVARYPRDPRARFFRAIALLDSNDNAGAERELRAGLAEEALWRPFFNPQLPLRMRTMLALLVNDRQPGEAKTIAKPVCTAAQAEQMKDLLDRQRLCES